jgi:hypothetical protein
MRKSLIIGYRGLRGSGKDTLSDMVAKEAHKDGYNPVKCSFAHKLKMEVASFLDTHSYKEVETFLWSTCRYDKKTGRSAVEIKDMILEEMFFPARASTLGRILRAAHMVPAEDYVGRYDEVLDAMHHPVKKAPFRQFLIWWGTEYRREMYGDDYWMRAVRKLIKDTGQKHPDKNFLFQIADVRFINELNFVKADLGGLTVNIVRPGLIVDDPHPSETELENHDGFDFMVNNAGTLADLQLDAKNVWTYALEAQHANVSPN